MAEPPSEPELATKAPESDLHEPSMISDTDSRAQTGASMGEHCTTDRPLSSDRQSSGTISKYKEVEVYISKPPDYPNTNAKLLLLLTGGTGLQSTNNQLQADMFASEGFVVVMPDLFGGDPAPNSKPAEEEQTPSFIEKLKMGLVDTVKSFTIDMWLARHTPEKVMPIIHTVLESASDEFADAKERGGGIYTVGYCFGAKYALILAGEHADSTTEGKEQKDEEADVGVVTKSPLVKCAAVAHGTMVQTEDLKAVKSPSLLICVGE